MGVGEDCSTFKGNYHARADLLDSSNRDKRAPAHHRFLEYHPAHSQLAGSRVATPRPAGQRSRHRFIPPSLPSLQRPIGVASRVKGAIQTTYPISEHFGDGQVVVVSFDDNPASAAGVRESEQRQLDVSERRQRREICNSRPEIAVIETRSSLTNRNQKCRPFPMSC
ncbi:hypothetical protein M2175_004016 [Bradyrhizobium elkanii]|uniref:hypothetical protein n=1 Tax=Bradyrhizobium TaxID=374 RepID=UPI00216831D4|nr:MULTISPECIES: hypothetical protein [Bradyrhizobium]MCS3928985.1 hypothetical protein [Bradyrhizobium elkanii]MCS3969541.1 hypothetical protein [Bradyrhizobium japonicum]